MGWGAPGLSDDLGRWGGEFEAARARDAQMCGGGPPPLGLLERDIIEMQLRKEVQNFDNIDIYLSDIDIKQSIITTPIIPIIDIINKSLYR